MTVFDFLAVYEFLLGKSVCCSYKVLFGNVAFLTHLSACNVQSESILLVICRSYFVVFFNFSQRLFSVDQNICGRFYASSFFERFSDFDLKFGQERLGRSVA